MKNYLTNSTIIPGREIYFTVFNYIDPLNIVLGTFVIILNSVLLYHFSHNSRTLTTKLFILITIADILSSVGHILPAWGEILYFKNRVDIQVFWWTSLSHRAFGLSAYFCSIFFNLIMALLRTIKIVSPLYQPSVPVLKVSITFYCILLGCLNCIDVFNFYNIATVVNNDKFWTSIVIPLFEFSIPGSSLFPDKSPWHGHLDIYGFSLFTLIVVPVVIVFICMIIQLSYVRYNMNQSPGNTPLIDWDHINMTVLLLSILFLVCNSAAAFTWCAMLLSIKNPLEFMAAHKYLCVFVGFVITTVPLVYATLFPVIILLRNRHLRKDILGKLKTLFLIRGTSLQ